MLLLDCSVRKHFLSLHELKHFSQSALLKKNAVAENSVLQSGPTTTKGVLFFPSDGSVRNCFQERQIHAGLHWESKSWIRVSGESYRTRCNAVLKSIDLE